VVLNRVLSDAFPDSVEAVLYAPGQFSPAHLLANTTPGDTQYRAVDEAMDGRETILPENVVYFAMSPQNSRLAAHIGCHYFCEL